MSLRPALSLLLTLAAAPLHAASLPVVVTGGPSRPLGLPFSSFANVALMDDGRAAFIGSSTGAFRRRGGVLEHVVAAGDVLPDGRQVAGVSAPAHGPGDCTVVRAFLVDGGSRILRRCAGAIETVAVTGEAAPGGGTLAEFVADVAAGTQGQVAFSAILSDGSTGLFLDAAGVRTDLVRTGSRGSLGGGFTALRLIGVAADGRVGFRGSVENGRDGLFLATAGRVQAVVEVGEASPVGGTFRAVAGASMNDAGTFAFRGELSEGGGGVFRVDTAGDTPRVQAVVREGDPVGDTDVRIRTLPSSLTPSINGVGEVAFRATVAGADGGSAVFVGAPGAGLRRIVGARDATAFGTLVRLRDPALADNGTLVLPASVTGGGPSLFVVRSGTVTALARIGETTTLDTGAERFRFSQPSVREDADGAVFLGSREGVFVASPDGSIQPLAFLGGPTPLGGTFAGFDPPAADGGDTVAFGAEIRDSSRASRAIIAASRGRLRAAAESATRVRGGRLVDFFVGTLDPLTRPGVGPRGEIAFEASLEGGRTPRALLVGRGRRPRTLVRASKPAAGGGEFESFGTPAVLAGRRIAFVAQVGGDVSTRAKMFLVRGGRAQPVAAQGGGAPGRLGGRFENFDPPDANAGLIAFRATLSQGREGVFLASRRALGLVVGTGDPAPGGGAFRSFSAPVLGASNAVFLARLLGAPVAPGLYRVRADAVPAADATAPAVEAVGLPGGASPLGGTIAEFGAFDASRDDRLAVVVDLVGGSARSALLLVDAGGGIVP